MLLRDIYRAWTGQGILEKTLEEFMAMLGEGRRMFDAIVAKLWNENFDEPFRDSIYEKDIGLNQMERKIRKQVVEHLAINPGQDVNYCLLLMSVVKDAERIGDYCKNLMDIQKYDPDRTPEDPFVERFREVERVIGTLFEDAPRAFKESDEKLGTEVIEKGRELKSTLIGIIKDVLASELPISKAVTYTLTARFYKRIGAHLSNVATAVVMPLHKVDYFDETELRSRKP